MKLIYEMNTHWLAVTDDGEQHGAGLTPINAVSELVRTLEKEVADSKDDAGVWVRRKVCPEQLFHEMHAWQESRPSGSGDLGWYWCDNNPVVTR